MNKKVDLRILKTQKAIKKAFLQIIKEKKYNKITIQDIADEAMINRNTFYLHYMDKDDFIDKYSDECFSKLEEGMNSNKSVKTVHDLSYDIFKELTERVFNVIKEDFDFYKVVLGDESIPNLTVKFTKVIRNHIGRDFKGTYKVFYAEYMIAGLIGVIRFWVNNPDKYSIEEIADMMIDIYSKDMIEILKK